MTSGIARNVIHKKSPVKPKEPLFPDEDAFHAGPHEIKGSIIRLITKSVCNWTV